MQLCLLCNQLDGQEAKDQLVGAPLCGAQHAHVVQEVLRSTFAWVLGQPFLDVAGVCVATRCNAKGPHRCAVKLYLGSFTGVLERKRQHPKPET